MCALKNHGLSINDLPPADPDVIDKLVDKTKPLPGLENCQEADPDFTTDEWPLWRFSLQPELLLGRQASRH